MAHKKTSPKNQPQFSLSTMRQYWLGKTKAQTSFQIDLKSFHQVATKFKRIIEWNFLLTD